MKNKRKTDKQKYLTANKNVRLNKWRRKTIFQFHSGAIRSWLTNQYQWPTVFEFQFHSGAIRSVIEAIMLLW